MVFIEDRVGRGREASLMLECMHDHDMQIKYPYLFFFALSPLQYIIEYPKVYKLNLWDKGLEIKRKMLT